MPKRIFNLKGFSLIELMIAVSLIGILTLVAFPSYQKFVIDGKRSAVQGYMLELATQQTNYLQDNRSYTSTITDLNVTASDDVTDNYTVTIATGPTTSAPSYTITATPLSTSVLASDGNLTLNHLGVKTPSTKW